MKSTDDRGLFATLIASSASAGDVGAIPATQTTSGDGSASIALGFPPETFVARSAGGVPPRGADMNGFLNLFSRSLRAVQTGFFGQFDADFAQAIGGYPAGAVVAGAIVGTFWVSTSDDNISTPGADGATWQSLFYGYATQSWATDSFNAGRLLNTHEQTITGNYVVPAGVMRIRVRSQSAGGSGGGSVDNVDGTGSSAGSSGSAGSYAEALYSVTPGQVIPCKLGKGGVGATAKDGASGGDTSFGPIGSLGTLVCPGGPGGYCGGRAVSGSAYFTPAPPQAALPTGPNIVFSQSGAAGLPGIAANGSAAAQSGGNSYLGSGGGGQVSYSNQQNWVPGGDARGYGGGGGAHANQQGAQNAGGAGADSIIIIEEYSS